MTLAHPPRHETKRPCLSDYAPFVGHRLIEEINLLGQRLAGRVIQNVNSTRDGGGVAEILRRMVPLMQQLGIDAQWSVIDGDQEFFRATKKIHNAIHGKAEDISSKEFSLLLGPCQGKPEEFLCGDVIMVHDPQPVSLVSKRIDHGEKWVWRCHIDMSDPPMDVWSFIQEFAIQYDAAVFSAPSFARNLPIPEYFIAPSIDPLSAKNTQLPEHVVDSVLTKYCIPRDKPIITQVSRFDHLKDPIGVIEAFEVVRSDVDCRLVLAGGAASDDPESKELLEKVKERAMHNADIHVLSLPPESDLEINAVQTASTVILQKSLREGFGLTISEAMWKRKPVVASAVGGILLQVRHDFNGVLCHDIPGAAKAVKQLLNNPDYARQLGDNGREHVRQNFLITRHLRDYLSLFSSLLQ